MLLWLIEIDIVTTKHTNHTKEKKKLFGEAKKTFRVFSVFRGKTPSMIKKEKGKTSDKQQQLVATLKELFMMDQADLDFGIYRIMNAKHTEIESFLNNELLPTIRETLQAGGKATDTQKELDELIKTLQDAGMNPDESPKVKELKALLGGCPRIESLLRKS